MNNYLSIYRLSKEKIKRYIINLIFMFVILTKAKRTKFIHPIKADGKCK